MPLNEVPAKAPVGLQCAFEIDFGAWMQVAEVRAQKRFLKEIEIKVFLALRSNCEARAVHRTLSPVRIWCDIFGATRAR